MKTHWIKLAAVTAAAALSASAAFAQTTDGEVKKVDKAQNKIMLKHAEIKNLDMPPMTMTFRVRDAKLLENLAEGQKVKFSAEKIDGQYVVTELKTQ